jgi:uncharacterized phage protein (TIGR01671 family)
MREILFRGKTPSQDEYFDDGEWVQGFYTRFNGEEHRIYSGYAETDCGDYYPDWCNVRPETVGQYTGLTDKSGKKIFEGDIIDIEYPITTVKCAVVEYVGSAFVGSTDCDDWELDNYYALKVIGNIHDNPELLKGE